MRVQPDFSLERKLWRSGVEAVAGVDEAGVGALAGPIVAAAVILAPNTSSTPVCPIPIEIATWPITANSVFWAAMEARRRAVEALVPLPAHVLVDGKRQIAGCRFAQTAIVEGDARSGSIAAASIVAKVTRDFLMKEYGQLHPEYGFERHKGYATDAHLAALARASDIPPTFVRARLAGRRAGSTAPILE